MGADRRGAVALDCTRCGACCCNPDENRAEGSADYVEVTSKDVILRHASAVARYVRRDEAGRTYLRLDAGQRCVGLRGALGRSVRCELYALRPAACRRVTAGDDECLRARRERGIDGATGRTKSDPGGVT